MGLSVLIGVPLAIALAVGLVVGRRPARLAHVRLRRLWLLVAAGSLQAVEIGRASCRERVLNLV